VKFGTEEGTFGPLLRAKFHPHRCNVSPLRGEKPQNRPLSRPKRNTGRFALRAMLPVKNRHNLKHALCLTIYHNVAYSNVISVWWDVWPLLYYKFTAESVSKEILKSLNIWQVIGGAGSWLPQAFGVPGHCHAERWRTRLRSDVWRTGTVVTASC